jgi:hypothetical protein
MKETKIRVWNPAKKKFAKLREFYKFIPQKSSHTLGVFDDDVLENGLYRVACLSPLMVNYTENPNSSVTQTWQCDISHSTGFKDKAGQEIYENDIVMLSHWDQSTIACRIGFLPDVGSFSVLGPLNTNVYREYPIPHERAEVVGNIYENSNLLNHFEHDCVENPYSTTCI